VLPLGTANDFARAAGVDPTQTLAALRAAVEGPPRPVDLGLCNHDYFVNVTTGGTLSQLSAEADPRLKRALSGLAYSLQALSGLGSLTGQAVELRGPSCSWSGEAYVVGVGNGRCVGGGFELCPAASITDGLLELTVIPADLELGAILSLISSGSVAGSAGVVRMRCPWVELRAAEPIHLNLDGEPRVLESARFEAAPRAALMTLPPSSALLGASRSAAERAV
jgi:YegS/Rv2252/BmrU family lipid kinase